jgi:hypothetical protein
VAESVNAEHTLDALLEFSDVALYTAKTEGRNRIKRADQSKPEGGSTMRSWSQISKRRRIKR